MSRPSEPGAGLESVSPSLVLALRRLLRPLVRLLLDHRLPFTYMAELMKGAYVEVATRELTLDDRPQTDSRVSLLTGVHRREVKRLRGELPYDDRSMPDSIGFGTLLAIRWTTEPPYCDAEGEPLPLPRASADPQAPSFDALVQSVSKDIRIGPIQLEQRFAEKPRRDGIAARGGGEQQPCPQFRLRADEQCELCLRAIASQPGRGDQPTRGRTPVVRNRETGRVQRRQEGGGPGIAACRGVRQPCDTSVLILLHVVAEEQPCSQQRARRDVPGFGGPPQPRGGALPLFRRSEPLRQFKLRFRVVGFRLQLERRAVGGLEHGVRL